MRRPVGIYIAGVILLVTGLLGLVIASFGILGAVSVPSSQTPMFPHFRALVFGASDLFAIVCVFLGWVAIDLFRMRIWARYATIALAVLGACYCGLSAVMMFVMQYVMPPNPQIRPELVHSIFDVLAILYLVLAAIAVFWVIYFNRKTVRAAFHPAAVIAPATFTGGAVEGIVLPAQPVHRSLSAEEIILKAFGVLLLIGGGGMILLVLLGMPLVLFGWILTGKAALLADLLLAALNFYAGLGLILRWRSGWLLTFAIELFALVIISLNFIPSYAARTMAASRMFAMHLAPGTPTGTPAMPIYPHLMMVTFAISDLLVLAILVLLFRSRRSYLS